MADGDNQERSTEDLSDEASPYRLEEMRGQGKVAQSRELTAVVALLGVGLAILSYGPTAIEYWMGYFKETIDQTTTTRQLFQDNTILLATFYKTLKTLAILTLPILFTGFIVSALTSFMQVGSIFSTDPLTPDLGRINPIQGFQRLFSLKQAVELLRLILRLSVMLMIAYVIVSAVVLDSSRVLNIGIGDFSIAMGKVSSKLFFSMVVAMLVFAGVDFWLQRREYSKSVRVTKAEAKQEHKEHDGDPMVRARIRAIQRDAARRRMVQAVKKADVIVTNPTHIAIAIQYDREKMAAPKVVAKGADFLAQQIKKIAAEAGVPMVENVPLARALYKSVKVGRAVPRNLYQAVAEVLAYIYKLKNNKY